METHRRGRTNGAARKALKSSATDVLDDLTSLRDDIAKLATAANKTARVEAAHAAKRLRAISQNLGQRARGGATYVGEQVREHPAAAIGVSLGAGLLLGFLLSRR